jgi:hypothetical protein
MSSITAIPAKSRPSSSTPKRASGRFICGSTPSIAYRGSGAIPSGFSGFEGRSGNQPGNFHQRVFPARLGSLRADGFRGWDAKILRRFRMAERANFSVAADILNLTNRTNFGQPVTNPTNLKFGRVTGQQGAGRTLQFTGRLEF